MVASTALRSGGTKSCGCLRRAINSQTKSTHGGSNTAEYRIWRDMRMRCSNPCRKGYRHYGGRGIRVCDRWWNSFEAFLTDMGLRASPQHSVERIDNNGHCEPDNCRWATAREQANNKSTNRRISHNGCTQSLASWAKETGIRADTIKGRLNRDWTPERALTAPVGPNGPRRPSMACSR
jgi:hypothetical protein